MLRVYTIGYQRRSFGDFYETLVGSGVRALVDIRRKPQSQLAGYAKRSTLEYIFTHLTPLSYAHHPRLAPSLALLQALKGGDVPWDEFADLYRAEVSQPPLIVEFLNLAKGSATCFMCFERDHTHCHRALLMGAMQEITGTPFEVVHL